MMKAFDAVPVGQDHIGDPCWELDKIAEHMTVKKLLPNFWVATNVTESWAELAFLDFYSSNLDGSGTRVNLVLTAEGPTGLRECRHTRWGREGYVYYMNFEHVRAALT